MPQGRPSMATIKKKKTRTGALSECQAKALTRGPAFCDPLLPCGPRPSWCASRGWGPPPGPDRSPEKTARSTASSRLAAPGPGLQARRALGLPWWLKLVKNPPAVWETWVQSLGWEDPQEKGKATHSSILAWRIL